MSPYLSTERNSFCFSKDMSSSSSSSSPIYSIELPYLGEISLGRSPLHLNSFQKPLLNLYVQQIEKQSIDHCRFLISNHDLFIFQSNSTNDQDKRALIYANFQSIVEVQILKLALKPFQVAFLPIGCEHEQRFRSVYSSIQQSQYESIANSNMRHSSLVLFVIRKPGLGESCSLLDCHIFFTQRESIAFELSEVVRKCLVRQTMSPIPSKRRTLLSTVELQQNNNYFSTNNNSPRNPFSLSQANDTSKVLDDIPPMSSPTKQRHFIKTSTIIQDETDEIVNDLMSIIEVEKRKSFTSIKRHASAEQLSTSSSDLLMNKKRFFHSKKPVDGQILRPQILVNRYGDIGNYVPKFLRENTTMRSSDSNENIFFRSSNGHIIDGFLKFDVVTSNTMNVETNILRNPQSSMGEIRNGIKIHPQPLLKPKRVLSNGKIPLDYRQYLRHTDQGVFLYGKERFFQSTLEHSLGYYP